jgi:hypothetical protein
MIGAYTAAIIALVLAIVEIIEIWSGWHTGITQDWIETILAVLAPVFAWLWGRGGA